MRLVAPLCLCALLTGCDDHAELWASTRDAGAASDAQVGFDATSPIKPVVPFLDPAACAEHSLEVRARRGWALGFDDGGSVTDLAMAREGSIAVAGTTRARTTVGGTTVGVTGGHVTSLDAAGTPRWRVAVEGYSSSPRLAVRPDGVLLLLVGFTFNLEVGGVSVSTESSIPRVALFAIDDAGHILWHHPFVSASQDGASDLAVDSANDVVVVGALDWEEATGDAGLAQAPPPASVMKLSSTGAPLWRVPVSGTGTVELANVDTWGAGEIVVAASFEGTLEIGGTTLGSRGFGNSTTFFMRLSPDGAVTSARTLGGAHDIATLRLVAGGDGSLTLAGTFSGEIAEPNASASASREGDPFVMRIGPDDATTWLTGFSGTRGSRVRALDVAPSGQVSIGGTSLGEVSFDGTLHDVGPRVRAFAARFATDGTPETYQSFASEFGASVNAIAHTADGAEALGGGFTCTLELPQGTVGAPGDSGFLAVQDAPSASR